MKKIGTAFRPVSFLAMVLCLLFMQLRARETVERNLQVSVENLEQILLNRDDAEKLLQVLEKVLDRAARPDAPALSDPSCPPSNLDLLDLEAIRRCVCIIKEQLKKVCSKLEQLDEDLSIHDAVICSKLIDLDEDLSRHDRLVCSKLIDLDEDLSRHDTVICSKLIDLDEDLSRHDTVICSKLINLDEDLSRHDTVICSKLIDLDVDLSRHDVTICSKLEDLDDDLGDHDRRVCSKLVDLDVDLSRHDTVICSKLIDLDVDLSRHDALICSKLSDMDGRMDGDLSLHDAVICSKIGQLDAEGSCFDCPLTLPDDINNTQLNVIQWLKSIMLMLHGCSEEVEDTGLDPFVCGDPF